MVSPPASPASSRRSRRLMAGCSPARSRSMPARRSAPSRTRFSAATVRFEAMAAPFSLARRLTIVAPMGQTVCLPPRPSTACSTVRGRRKGGAAGHSLACAGKSCRSGASAWTGFALGRGGAHGVSGADGGHGPAPRPRRQLRPAGGRCGRGGLRPWQRQQPLQPAQPLRRRGAARGRVGDAALRPADERSRQRTAARCSTSRCWRGG